jgi:hypothetical protein
MRFLILTIALLCYSPGSQAGRIFTFLEGTIIERNKQTVVLSTTEGIYWINAGRPLSWLRKLSGKNRFSFWVRVDQIRRFRPATVNTAAELSP